MRLTKLTEPFKFAPNQVTLLAVLIYAVVFVSVLVYDELADVPKNTRGLDLERAYDTLSEVSRRRRGCSYL